MFHKSPLLHVDVDVEARIVAIQVDKGNPVNGTRGSRHVLVHVRVLVPRVGVIDDQPGHAAESS